MASVSSEDSKALILNAFDAPFNKRDYKVAAPFWSDSYIQHSAHIPPDRDSLLNLVRSLPETLRYENHLAIAEGEYAICHGRFSDIGN
jgi:predicted SnoaL-like aldol condensation-catalyzing enzyme